MDCDDCQSGIRLEKDTSGPQGEIIPEQEDPILEESKMSSQHNQDRPKSAAVNHTTGKHANVDLLNTSDNKFLKNESMQNTMLDKICLK